ncbi:AcrR family transcriptional regulator [Thermocatellispora tengchongensis]|uniref:AcrR family transcriptional regulator n=1 Tax=Thermocatellispora tengchongensis TaxID=1073253 RepID=A0A840PAH4_9ACTN|nr:TetR family transcriptional regulator [Thermocatellispora tengchongensis]MBB5136009.1 AcrR family transcriptional regulator [Thermocatellispora tengchongensis]
MAGVKGQVQRRGVERRRAIIEAAIDLFSRRGYRNTGIAAVAEQAGVTAPAVVHHFGSKEKLLEAVLAELDERALRRLTGYQSRDTLASLRAIVRDAEHTVADPATASLYTVLEVENLASDAPLHHTFRRRSRLLRFHLAELLREGVRAGELDAGLDPDMKAREIVAFMEGAQLLWLLDPEEVDLVALSASYVDTLVTSIAAHPPGPGPGSGSGTGGDSGSGSGPTS